MRSSPFSRTLGKICELLLEPQSRLVRLDSETSLVQALLRSLYDERDNVSRFIEKHRALIKGVGREWDRESSTLSASHCLNLLSLCPQLVFARLDVGGLNFGSWSMESS